MPIIEVTLILYSFCMDFQVYQCKKLLPSADENTIIEWYRIFRDLCSKILMNDTVKLGEGVDSSIVEIDESLFGKKRKYHRGTGNQHFWVFGMVERGTKKCVLHMVDDRKRETLLPIITRYVKPGTTIYSDQWAAYNTIPNEGYNHLTVNHNVQFKSSEGCCTNAIEGLWGLAKLRIKKMKGVLPDKLPSILDEFMYRHTYGHSNGDIFEKFCKDLSEIKDLKL